MYGCGRKHPVIWEFMGKDMAQPGINRLAESVGDLCARHVVEEKQLLAPSRRVGFQWLDVVTRAGQPVLNARVKTLAALALELAAPEMERRGLSFIHGVRAELLVDTLLARALRKGGYLSHPDRSPGLVRAVAATLRDLRLSGLTAKDLSPRHFEVAAKGREIISLLSSYEEELSSRNLVDLAGVLRLAAERLADGGSPLTASGLIAAPEDGLEDMTNLERALWTAVPEGSRVMLAADLPGGGGAGEGSACGGSSGEGSAGGGSACGGSSGGSGVSVGSARATGDSALLAWISHPADAPLPPGDGSVDIFRAVGEVNEIREVLRRCVEAGIPFDEVEVLYTDACTYIPLLYEACSLLAPEPGGAPPVTFLEGIPVRYSRPGRALAAWLSWIGEDYPQSILVRMVQDGLLRPDTAPDTWNFSRMGAVLRALPIGRGRGHYLPAIGAELEALEWRKAHHVYEENGEEDERAAAYPERHMALLRSLRDMVAELLSAIPAPLRARERPPPASDGFPVADKQGAEGRLPAADRVPATAWLLAAESFLTHHARGVNELDEYGRLRLLDEIRDSRSCLEQDGMGSLDAERWLSELVRTARVEGKGPRPGCIYAAPLAAGGHSGRPHTFVTGLDDGRFPGAGLQDPLLLDAERVAISADLPTAAKRLAASLEDFSRLAARLRGRVTLSYCSRSLADDRDMFPSPVLLAAYRIITGDRGGVQDDLLAWLPEPASFAPQDPESCLDMSEWWLHRLCGEREVEDPEGTVTSAFPHLGRGMAARRARGSDLFTAYDGWVPEAGADHDPSKPDGPVLSASRLETLGRCPMEYFFAYILGIEPPEEYLPDPSRWLEPTEKGSLLHTVFQRFHQHLLEENRRPVFPRDWDILREILAEEMRAWERRKPPPNREVYEREVEDLRRSARIFLQEEEGHCAGRRPLYFEVAIGMEAAGKCNRIDSPQPVELALPNGKAVRTRGYIDRIDELGEPGSLRFAVCDYKTGSSYGYHRADPFRQGRRIQNLVYLAQARSRLAECHPGAEVDSFQYFFPSTREHGERIEWSAGDLAEGMRILERLCDMLARGCFPFTDDKDDVSISDFRPAFGDIEGYADVMKKKLSNPANRTLAPFRELRGYAEEEHGYE